MSSRDHAGWRKGPRGPNSSMYGLMSSTGVPSMASRPRTKTRAPLTATSSHDDTPMRLGRSLAR